MADGGLNIEIDERLADQIRSAASAAGMTPEDYATSMLRAAVDADWAEDERRWEEYKRTGEYVTVEDAMTAFDRAVSEAVARK